MADPLWAVRKLKQNPQWLDELLTETKLDRNWGRPRIEGSWALMYIAFVTSGRSDIEPWWGCTPESTWHECGFASRPCYQTVWNRFSELELVAGGFATVAGKLIQKARHHSGGEVGRDLHVDGTEAETNARLVHDCRSNDNCARQSRFPKRMHADEARAARHRDDAEAPPEDPDALPEGVEAIEDEAALPYKRIKLKGCWYRTFDKTAGVRTYRDAAGNVKSSWHGFYNLKATDHYTGAPVAIVVCSATEQEYNAYPDVLESSIKAIGGTPRSVVADRGLSVGNVFELNTRTGIASVMPFRKSRHVQRREDKEHFDRHGIPRCKKCGGLTRYVRFAAEPSPRLWFRCLEGATPECARDQSIACSNGWKSLLPLWRTEPAYFALKDSHSLYERVHNLWRTRYRVGAATHEMRPKRRGLGWQQLRANAALIVEWLRILDREGWMGSARRNRNSPLNDLPGLGLGSLLGFRLRQGLNIPYGPKAVALGVGPLRPVPPGSS